jgi:putative transposase
MSNLPLDAVGVMDRGFAGLNFMQELVQKDKYFVVRIKNNWKLEFGSEDGRYYEMLTFLPLIILLYLNM